MPYVREWRLKDGARRFAECYLGPDGKYHEEGGFTARPESPQGRRQKRG